MAKIYKIEHEKEVCIGCGACAAVAPKFWVMEDGLDGSLKSHVTGSKKVSKTEELDLDEKDFAINKEAAESCPVNCIHIRDLKTKQRIL